MFIDWLSDEHLFLLPLGRKQNQVPRVIPLSFFRSFPRAHSIFFFFSLNTINQPKVRRGHCPRPLLPSWVWQTKFFLIWARYIYFLILRLWHCAWASRATHLGSPSCLNTFLNSWSLVPLNANGLPHGRVAILQLPWWSGQYSVRSIMYKAHLLQGSLNFFFLLTVRLVPSLLSPGVRPGDNRMSLAGFPPENMTQRNTFLSDSSLAFGWIFPDFYKGHFNLLGVDRPSSYFHFHTVRNITTPKLLSNIWGGMSRWPCVSPSSKHFLFLLN